MPRRVLAFVRDYILPSRAAEPVIVDALPAADALQSPAPSDPPPVIEGAVLSPTAAPPVIVAPAPVDGVVIPSRTEPEPPPIERNAPGAYALFMDEDEKIVLYQKANPYVGCPTDDRTNSVVWSIEGRSFAPSHRNEHGDWIFRRCAR